VAAPGELYTAFIEGELKNERERRSTLDARGASLVSSSTGLLGLVVALSTLAVGNELRVTGVSAYSLAFSVAAFVISGVFGIFTTFGRWYKVARVSTLRSMITDPHWTDPEFAARLVCATTNVNTVASLRKSNNTKADLLTWGLSVQLLAVVSLAVAVGVEFYDELVQ
jgi:hypothetical protein